MILKTSTIQIGRWLFSLMMLVPMICLGQSDAQETRQAFLKLIERSRVPLKPTFSLVNESEGLAQWQFIYNADAQNQVPGIMIKQANARGRLPVIVALHGTGGNKESQLELLRDVARLGFIGVAIDGRYHGARTRTGKGAVEYNEAILRAYRTGKEHPFLYDTVWDIIRLLDLLETRVDVDAKRIGMIGFSKGGMELYLAAAMDQRIAVSVPCIGVQSFGWALDNNAWQSRVSTFQMAIDAAAKDEGVAEINTEFVRKFYDRVMPGIADRFDGQNMLQLIAPRPLLVINGDTDARTPLPGLMQCIDNARAAYQRHKAEDKFKFILQENTGHAVTPAARKVAIDWFTRWLKPKS